MYCISRCWSSVVFAQWDHYLCFPTISWEKNSGKWKEGSKNNIAICLIIRMLLYERPTALLCTCLKVFNKLHKVWRPCPLTLISNMSLLNFYLSPSVLTCPNLACLHVRRTLAMRNINLAMYMSLHNIDLVYKVNHRQ